MILKTITVDPFNAFPSAPKDDILQSFGGFIPGWFMDDTMGESEPMKEFMEEKYGFPLCEIEGGTLNDDGTYQYPEDPKQVPLIVLTSDKEVLRIYNYAIITIQDIEDPTKVFVSRCD